MHYVQGPVPQKACKQLRAKNTQLPGQPAFLPSTEGMAGPKRSVCFTMLPTFQEKKWNAGHGHSTRFQEVAGMHLTLNLLPRSGCASGITCLDWILKLWAKNQTISIARHVSDLQLYFGLVFSVFYSISGHLLLLFNFVYCGRSHSLSTKAHSIWMNAPFSRIPFIPFGVFVPISMVFLKKMKKTRRNGDESWSSESLVIA